MTSIHYTDLNWNELWREAKRRKPWKSKKVDDWDQRAASFAKRTAQSLYVQAFLDKLDPQPEWSVLDVGCGPGTLALPLASRVRTITGLDFSPRMLDIFRDRIAEHKYTNIDTRQLAWEDDWEAAGIHPHDVVIASRSMAVRDLELSLRKLDSMAVRRVVVTDKVRHGPFDPDAFTAVGRSLETGPDYIYTVNLLYQMGHLPEVDYIQLEESMVYASFTDLLTSYTWMFRDLQKDEEKRLIQYLRSSSTEKDGQVLLHRRTPPIWAYISWCP